MCGISGFIRKGKKMTQKESEDIVKGMLSHIRHRGGDSFGIKSVGKITIGHTRLSVTGTSRSSDQPLSDKEGHSVMSFNGEIYNHRELRAAYAKSLKLNPASDTVTLFGLLTKYDISFVLRTIQGMFAFSFLDTQKGQLHLAVDKLAIKPLYYIDTPDYFAWASEAKAFKAIPKYNFEIDKEAIGEYLVFRYVSGRGTLFKNVYKLQAGEHLTLSVQDNEYSIEKYYELGKSRASERFSEKTLSSSVKDHLMGNYPVGIQLSGGIDSSLVALYAQNFSEKKLHTFSIGLEETKWNEFSYSDQVSKKLNTRHHKIIFSKRDFVGLLEKITYHLDEPLAHPNTIPMYLLAKEARKYTKVLLTGEGADEIFYGYNRYFDKKNNRKKLVYSNAFVAPEVVTAIFKGNINIANRVNILKKTKNFNQKNKISFYDIYTYLPHVLLRQDKAGMAANIENRVPFLYPPVTQGGYDYKYNIGVYGGKNILKKIALKYFPKELVLRRKCGFGLPISDWLRDQDALLDRLMRLSQHNMIKEYFHVDVIQSMIEKHVNREIDNSEILFSLISLAVWHDTFIDSKAKLV